MTTQFQISRDTQALFITIVAKDRLPIFRTDAIKLVTCNALNEARCSGEFLIFAYVIMLEHLHLLTSQPRSPSEILRYIKGITARRVIDYLKGHKYESSLAKLTEGGRRQHSYSLWQKEKNVLPIFSEPILVQKANYIHQNPVRAGFADRAIDYRWSSARIWQGCPLEDEPFRVDFDRIVWRKGR